MPTKRKRPALEEDDADTGSNIHLLRHNHPSTALAHRYLISFSQFVDGMCHLKRHRALRVYSNIKRVQHLLGEVRRRLLGQHRDAGDQAE